MLYRLISILALFSTTLVFASEPDVTLPSDYKSRVERYIADKQPNFGRFYYGWFIPRRALVGEQKKECLAVRCDWSGDLKNGTHLLMIVKSIFYFEGERIVEMDSDAIEWVGGEPTREKGPNQSPEPTAMLVTPRAVARVAPSTAVAHL